MRKCVFILEVEKLEKTVREVRFYFRSRNCRLAMMTFYDNIVIFQRFNKFTSSREMEGEIDFRHNKSRTKWFSRRGFVQATSNFALSAIIPNIKGLPYIFQS